MSFDNERNILELENIRNNNIFAIDIKSHVISTFASDLGISPAKMALCYYEGIAINNPDRGHFLYWFGGSDENGTLVYRHGKSDWVLKIFND